MASCNRTTRAKRYAWLVHVSNIDVFSLPSMQERWLQRISPSDFKHVINHASVHSESKSTCEAAGGIEIQFRVLSEEEAPGGVAMASSLPNRRSLILLGLLLAGMCFWSDLVVCSAMICLCFSDFLFLSLGPGERMCWSDLGSIWACLKSRSVRYTMSC